MIRFSVMELQVVLINVELRMWVLKRLGALRLVSKFKDIIRMIRTGDKDLESKLYSMNPSLSFDSCTQDF
ncbi:hypothetical protein M0R45_027082 [Rubus argutus]|uniref:Uncharacterized protein n=1 Tax=Rubus argutus TaxID=59490 RepID=A0AAW1WZB2_RUBAR